MLFADNNFIETTFEVEAIIGNKIEVEAIIGNKIKCKRFEMK